MAYEKLTEFNTTPKFKFDREKESKYWSLMYIKT